MRAESRPSASTCPSRCAAGGGRLAPPPRSKVEHRGVRLPASPPLPLGLIHGDVRPAQQLGRMRVTVTDGHTDADPHVDGTFVQTDRGRLHLVQSGGNAGKFGAADEVRAHHDEFVTADSTRRVPRADDELQSLRHLLQDAVAGIVAVNVVDVLEVIDVEIQQPYDAAHAGLLA